MKKLTSVLMMSLLLGACADTGTTTSNNGGLTGAIGSIFGSNSDNTSTGQTGITNNLVKMYVKNQCATELNKRKEWRLVALAMSAEKQAELEDSICGCVSEEAPNQITAADMSQVLSESGRTQVLANLTTKTVTACYNRLVTGK